MPKATRKSPGDDNEKAVSLADQLLRRIENPHKTPELVEAEIEISGIEWTVDRFAQMFDLSKRLGEPLPCIIFSEDEKVPIDVLPELSSPLKKSILKTIDIFRYNYLGLLGDWSKDDIYPARAEEALSFFRTGLIKFLKSTFSSKNQPPPHQPPSYGIPFEVATKKNGKRVHYTYSHLINTNPVFGSPSSPVKGYMKPGVWKFGVWENGAVHLDPADFDVPRLNRADLIV